MGGVIPALIVLFNYLIFSGVIPDGVTMNYIIISQNIPPPISAMYLSNFAHANWSHLLENMGSFILIICNTVIIIRFIIPTFNNVSNPVDIFNPNTLVKSSLLFLTVVPFLIAAEAVVFLYLNPTATGVTGFSGIGFAFEGYLIYLVEMLIFWKIIHTAIVKGRPFLALIGIVLLIITPLYVLLSQFHAAPANVGSVNYGAHLVGFMLGVVIPYLMDRKRICEAFK